MRRGGIWRVNNEARQQRQQHDDPDEVIVLPSGRRLRGSTAGLVLTTCVASCIVLLLWAIWEFRPPTALPFGRLERPPHQAGPVRAAVFQLFRYYVRRPNGSDAEWLSALASQHRRRRRRLLEAPSPSPAEAKWSLFGGRRTSDLDMEAHYIKVKLGTQASEFYMHIDTGSGISWVHCKGRNRIKHMGPNGMFEPQEDSYVHCETRRRLCKQYQHQDSKKPCGEKYQFKCFFEHSYGDGLLTEGAVVEESLTFGMTDGTPCRAKVAFGCVDRVVDEETAKNGQDTADTDGLVGLGDHPSAWHNQLRDQGLVAHSVVAICVDTAIGRSGAAGFVSFGNPYTSYPADKLTWTPMAPTPNLEESMYTARLMSVKYRNKVIRLNKPRKRRRGRHRKGVNIGFDSGSDLTYFTRRVYDKLKDLLDEDAKSLGYEHIRDSKEFIKSERRPCWTKLGTTRDSVKDFGDLTLRFAAPPRDPADDGTTSDLIVKAENFITWGGHPPNRRTCLNVLREDEYDFGNLGAEVLKGYLVIFNNDLRQIGWSQTSSCTQVS